MMPITAEDLIQWNRQDAGAAGVAHGYDRAALDAIMVDASGNGMDVFLRDVSNREQAVRRMASLVVKIATTRPFSTCNAQTAFRAISRTLAESGLISGLDDAARVETAIAIVGGQMDADQFSLVLLESIRRDPLYRMLAEYDSGHDPRMNVAAP